MRPIRLFTVSILLFPVACCLAGAQDLSQIDTLAAAVVTDSPVLQKRSVSELSTDIEVIRAVVSPLGEGDAIRWAQTMPGVTTGADGTAAFYVRGSNMGNNLFSLDGVPIYGYTHLLGLTTVVPTSVIKDATLTKGGFDATDNNFTSAHLRIDSRRPDRGYRVSGAINNFLVSAGGEANFNDRISFVASARISPLTLEYQAFKGIASSLVGGISGFNAQIGDLYGKFRWDINSRNSLELFGLGTLDRYSLSLSEDSRQGMGWHNGIAQLRYAYEGERGRFTTSVSYNRYGSSQEEDKVYREVRNYLSLKSDMTEVTARVDRLRRAGRRERMELSYGAKYRYAQFEPGDGDGRLLDALDAADRLEVDLLQILFREPVRCRAQRRFKHAAGCTEDHRRTGRVAERGVIRLIVEFRKLDARFADHVREFAGRDHDVHVTDAVVAELRS